MNLNQENRILRIGLLTRVIVINVEGMTRAKAEFLSKVSIEIQIDIIMLQETHISSSQELHS